MEAADKNRERVLRDRARRRGMLLERCRRRDQAAVGYGRYRLVNAETSEPVSAPATQLDPGGAFTLSLQEASDLLDQLAKGEQQ